MLQTAPLQILLAVAFIDLVALVFLSHFFKFFQVFQAFLGGIFVALVLTASYLEELEEIFRNV